MGRSKSDRNAHSLVLLTEDTQGSCTLPHDRAEEALLELDAAFLTLQPVVMLGGRRRGNISKGRLTDLIA